MNEAEFDKFAEEYGSLHQRNISITGESPEYFTEYKIKDLASVWTEYGTKREQARILDLGAGVGASVQFIHKHFNTPETICLDVSFKSLQIGNSRFGDTAQFLQFDGRRIPFSDGTFDMAVASCVFHHIPKNQRVTLLKEVRRVLTPNGLVLIYEHNPYNPLTVRAVRTCPFDVNAELLNGSDCRQLLASAGFKKPITRYRVFFPHWLRWLRSLESQLTRIPLGAQYYTLGFGD